LAHRVHWSSVTCQHRLPAVYGNRNSVNSGGLIFYGPDRIEQFRRAAGYVDRVLKGENPGDLPVQAPTKYDFVINLKTAKALGIDLPPSLLDRCHRVNPLQCGSHSQKTSDGRKRPLTRLLE
jgi:putative ABC transport system substrate-binding protein